MNRLDVKMDDEEPASAVTTQEKGSDEEAWALAVNLRSRTDMGGGLLEGGGDLREFENTNKRERDKSDTESEGRQGMEQEVAELAQQGAVLQETAVRAEVPNGE